MKQQHSLSSSESTDTSSPSSTVNLSISNRNLVIDKTNLIQSLFTTNTKTNSTTTTLNNKSTTTNKSTSAFMQSALGIKNEISTIEYEIQSFISHLLREQQQQQFNSINSSSPSINNNNITMNEIVHDEIDGKLIETNHHLTLLKNIIDYQQQQQQSNRNNNNYHQLLHYKSIIQLLNQSLNHCKHLLTFTQSLINKNQQKQQIIYTTNDNDIDSNNSTLNEMNDKDVIIQQELLKQLSTTTSANTTDLQDAHDTERTALHISELLTLFESKVEEQSEMINLFESNIEQANDCIEMATDELRRANNDGKDSDGKLPFPYNFLPSYINHLIKYFVSYLFVVLGLILFIYDRIKL